MRNRQKQKDNRKKQREESLNRRNDEGYLDLTAFMALASIRRETIQKMKGMK